MSLSAKHRRAKRGNRALVLLVAVLFGLAATPQSWAQQVLGSIIGRVRVERGDAPPQRVLVNLDFRGATIASVYTDSQGTYGFHALAPNPYVVTIDDDQYQPAQKSAIIESTNMAPIVFVDITLIPRKAENHDSAGPQPSGSNPNMIDTREYSSRFPKRAVREFEKGMEADHAGQRDNAIHHYEKAVAIAPEFYEAHNNLGSDYLSKSDLAAARREFERVVVLNQSDAAAYFNLSNVCMLAGQLSEAQKDLDEGLRRQPDSAFAQFLLGSLNQRLGKVPQAEAALRRAIQLDPLMAQARLQLVNLLLQQGRNQDAAAQLRDFLNIFPDNSFSSQARQVLQRLEAPAKPLAAVTN
jgi:tetratricopeptide (TPR) repeat protein